MLRSEPTRIDAGNESLIEAFVSRYASKHTRDTYARLLRYLFRSSGQRRVEHITPGHIARWVGEATANNTARARISLARTFFGWTTKHGHTTENPADDLDHLVKSYPKTYGKKQGKYDPRFLDKEEAFGRLVGACQDGTLVGMRDELIVRLGLAGARSSEIRGIKIGGIDLDKPLISYMGKKNKHRTIVPGTNLCNLITRYLDAWRLKKEPKSDDTLICSAAGSRGGAYVRWGVPLATHVGPYLVVRRRAEQAGLGHLSPHDLRRTCASILDAARSPDGGRLYDLGDIQRVLDHSNPATTVASYIDPMHANDTKKRASSTLD